VAIFLGFLFSHAFVYDVPLPATSVYSTIEMGAWILAPCTSSPLFRRCASCDGTFASPR
jgi:hypothetical protein